MITLCRPEAADLRRKRVKMIHTVFPKDADEMPQDFPTWEGAKEYAEENFSECGYTIESTEGECE